MENLKPLIEDAFEKRGEIRPDSSVPELRAAVEHALLRLDRGESRVAEKTGGEWQVNEWLKKAVLLSFRLHGNQVMRDGVNNYFDKVPTKYADYNSQDFQDSGVRVVAPAVARRGSYVAPGAVLMPSYINIGAYVDERTMIDTWATVGSCAQVGKDVHLSGGAGIGGVLEPLQANPTIIEDKVFIGARSEVVEGVIVEEGAILSMGVFIGQSTKIYNRETGEVTSGRIPPGAVVVPGNLPASDGTHSLYCAVIIKQVDQKTRDKVGINELLRP